jgi:branched-chain amino acid transport system substrate-binding protein
MERNSRRKFLKGAGAASAIALSGCLGDDGGGNGNGGGGNGSNGGTAGNAGGEGTISVGFIESLTGPFAGPGQRRLWATRAARDRVNEEGGINGREIELIVRDTETDPGTATTRAQSLINEENIELMCGTFSSSVCLAVAPIVARNQIPYSAGYCATRELTGESCTEYAFRGTRNNAQTQWLGFAPYLYEQGYESASIMYADYAWGQSELQFFKQYYEGETLSEVPVPAGTSDFSQYLSNVDTSADMLVFIQAGGDSINLLQDIQSFGTHEEVDRIATVGAGIGEFLEEGGINDAVATSLTAVNYYPKFLTGPLDTDANQQFHEIYADYAEGNPLPTRASSTGWEAIHLFRDIAEEIDYTGPDQAQEFVDTWRGFEMEESLAYPQGDKYYRSDNQCQLNQYVVEVQSDYTEEIVDTIPYDETDDYEITCTGDFVDA